MRRTVARGTSKYLCYDAPRIRAPVFGFWRPTHGQLGYPLFLKTVGRQFYLRGLRSQVLGVA